MPAIDYTSLFTRLGRIGRVAYVLNGNQSTLPADLDDISDLYETTTDEDLVSPLLASKTSLVATVPTMMQTLTTLAQNTLTRMVAASSPATARNYQSALVELIRQMTVDAESVAACTVGASAVALTGNTGSGVVVLTTRRGDGRTQDNITAETLRLACVADSYTGGATVGRESFRLAAASLTTGVWDYLWPNASGANRTFNCISADQDASSSGNLLTNGDMESWSTDATPELSNWTLSGGTWGTDLQRSATGHRGSYATEFIAGTGNNPILYQTFGTDTGATPSDLTSYAVNFFARKVSGTISAGVLTVELTDDTGTVLNDEQGTPNSTTVTLSTLTTSYAAQNVVFRTPGVPPSEVRVRFRMSTALVGGNVLIDDACFAPVQAAYPGGFGIQVFSGATPFVAQDGWDVTATNNRAGATYAGTWQSLFDRVFNMKNLNLLLPTSGSPTIADTLITAP